MNPDELKYSEAATAQAPAVGKEHFATVVEENTEATAPAAEAPEAEPVAAE